MSTAPLPERFERVLVYGLGLSGRAALRLLAACGARAVAVDDRGDAVEVADLPVEQVWTGAQVPAELPAGIDAVVLSPGVPGDRSLLEDARRRGVPVLAEVELAFPLARGPVAAVTGSNGKSTTTALTGALLQAAGWPVVVCGNIGRPFAEAVLEDPHRTFVVELSSFQLETIDRFHPRAAALLNLAPDHLDRYPDLAAYGAAKRRIFLNQGPGDVAVVNADDPWTAALAVAGRRRSFSRQGPVEDGCYLYGDQVLEAAPGSPPVALFTRADLPLLGEHNLENAMAAALLARALGVSGADLRRGLAGFRGLPHRMEKVAEVGGAVFINDSKGTNPAATLRSLEGLPDGRVHLILGGLAKGTDFREMVPLLARKAVRVYLIGKAAAEIAAALGGRVPHGDCGGLERAVTEAAERARPGDVVLLSPACASFDQFRNFEHRGEEFARLARGLAAGGEG
jgi:UDP-N-acetylmuramoylalanine--D-glutamate ligase